MVSFAFDSNEERSDRRDRSIDIAKGIGIILVVVGHSLVGLDGAMGLDVWRDVWLIFIYSFHMAFFFFISGATSASSVSESRYDFIFRLIRSFVYPYFLWSSIIRISAFLMNNYTNKPLQELDLLSAIYQPPSVMWFLYVLFGAFLILRLTSNLSASWRFIIAVGLSIGGYFIEFWLLGNLRLVGLFLLSAQFGILPKAIRLDWRLLFLSLSVLTITAFLAWHEALLALDTYPASSMAYLPAAFAGTFLIIWIATILDRSQTSDPPFWLRWLSVLGKKTLPIFVMHIMVTAGTRIALMKIGVANSWGIGITATILGLLIPLCSAIAAERMGISQYLGWATKGSSNPRRELASKKLRV